MWREKCKTTHKKRIVLHVLATDNCFLLILPDSYFSSLCSARVLVTTGSMRRYLQPNQVAQVVQILKDGTSIHALTRRFAVSPRTVSRAHRRYQETGCNTKRGGQSPRRSSTQQRLGICSLEPGGTGGALPEPYKMTSNRQLVCMFLTKLSETDSMRMA